MTTKTKEFIGGVALLLAFALGRYSTPVKTVTQTVTVHDVVDKKDTHVDEDKKTTTTTTTTKDGTSTTTTTMDDHIATKTTDKTAERDTLDSKSTTEKFKSTLTLSALAATSITNPTTLMYGGQITKQLIGPVTVGAFGLTNGTVGMSIGIQF